MTRLGRIKCTLFLHMSGEKATEVYNTPTFTDTEKGSYKALMRKFQVYVQDKKDIDHERCCFTARTQREAETFLSFLRHTETGICEYKHLKDSIIHDCHYGNPE